ncbi:chromatin-remodeling complex subunit ies6 [Oleoguttula sp. CCFEE 5521]
MAPITTASNEETHAALLDTLDMQKVHKPFRNPNWKPAQRRNKNLKQIISETSRTQQSLMTTQQNSGASTPLPATTGSTTPAVNLNAAQASQDMSRLVLEKNARQANGGATVVPSIAYTSIAAAPSLKPKKKYCDITGLPAKYKDPQFGMYYYNAEVIGIYHELPSKHNECETDSAQAQSIHQPLSKLAQEDAPAYERPWSVYASDWVPQAMAQRQANSYSFYCEQRSCGQGGYKCNHVSDGGQQIKCEQERRKRHWIARQSWSIANGQEMCEVIAWR